MGHFSFHVRPKSSDGGLSLVGIMLTACANKMADDTNCNPCPRKFSVI